MTSELAPRAAFSETRLAVRPKRLLRTQFLAQAYQHVPAVFTVLAAGISAIRSERGGGGLAVAATELLVGAWVLVTIVQEARHLFGRAGGRASPARDGALHEGGHGAAHGGESNEISGIDVPGLAAAALGYVEVWHHAHARGHFKLISPFMLSATVTLLFALGGRRVVRRALRRQGPHLAVTPDGVTYRGGRLRRWTASWVDVDRVDHAPGELVVRLKDGRQHVLRADDHFGGHTLVEAACAAVARHAPARLAPAPLSRP